MLLAVCFSSCKKEPEADSIQLATPDQITFDMHGGEQRIEFTPNGAWKAQSSKEWCTLSSASGSYLATFTKVIVPVNDKFEPRSAEITITRGSASVKVTVNQAAADGIIVMPEQVNLPYSAKTFTVETKSSSDVTASIDTGGRDWLSASGETGTNEKVFSFSASPNMETKARTTTITFTASGYTSKVSVYQVGRPDDSYVIPGDDIPNHPSVRPEGKANWTRTEVADGIVYWEFKGKDPVSKTYQFVNVADIDLNKGYKLGYMYDPDYNQPSHMTTCSVVMKQKDAIVATNAGFGATQIFIKVGGVIYKRIDKDKNSDTGVLNWRNDAGICTSPEGRVFIANAIFSQDGDGQSEYGAQLAQQRKFYTETLKDMPDIISGSPLLIDGYEPLGLTYIPAGESYRNHTNDTEHPFYHQDYRHPRTAIGLTGDNHLIMFVVNGRLTNCGGFNAKEMTQFLIDNFDPKYAMNLDGGGSSTMCVKGLGDPDTHVVNWPCDNKKCDHAGERTVQTFLYITK